jgi:hypothetical protein
LLGVSRTTDDFDIWPALSKANLDRLAATLNEVEASGSPSVERWSARSFRAHTSL